MSVGDPLPGVLRMSAPLADALCIPFVPMDANGRPVPRKDVDTISMLVHSGAWRFWDIVPEPQDHQ